MLMVEKLVQKGVERRMAHVQQEEKSGGGQKARMGTELLRDQRQMLGNGVGQSR